MKTNFLLQILTAFLVLIFANSCEKSKETIYNWNEVRIPKSGAVYAMSGNVESRLIIAGNGEVFASESGGEEWSVVLEGITAYELRAKADTLYAIALYNKTYTDFYSVDNGNSWTVSKTKAMNDLRYSQVEDSKGNLYRLVLDNTYPKRPDGIIKSKDAGRSWEEIFPFKRYIYSIYLDEADRLYVGTNGWDWNGDAFENLSSESGYIYYLE